MDRFYFQHQKANKSNTEGTNNPEVANLHTQIHDRPGILVIGQDLNALEELLRQTEGLGIDVYTYSEMLTTQYTTFKRYSHFIGNYGNVWRKPYEEFESFNGIFLFTTNGIVPPLRNSAYLDRIYTTGSAGIPGATHICSHKMGQRKDFSELIAHATRCMPPKKIQYEEFVSGDIKDCVLV